ncbi:uncharacterized protein LOC128951905 [Oppia nitens]|uniref:uncharacterized protein LOC128951905 n=1 Tax=Oppia nitens TaxID=1686743 RepID=UPI0023DB39EB|nr:uncharacterized protein LOC128951905 [Oppia nitens]
MLIFGQLVQIVLLVLISVNILLIKSTTDLCDDTVGTNTTPTPSSTTPTTTKPKLATTTEPMLGTKYQPNRGTGFTVSLRTIINGSDEHLCSGTIISPYWILTAASCVYNRNVSSIKVFVKHYAINHTVIYDHYSPETNENNIALVRLKDYIVDNSLSEILSLGDQPVANWSLAYLHDWETKKFYFMLTINARTIDWKHCTSIVSTYNTTTTTNNNNNTKTKTKIPIINSNNICLLTAKGEGVCRAEYNDDVGGAVTVDKQYDSDNNINNNNNNSYPSRKTKLIGILSADLSCGRLDGGGGGQPKVVTSILPFLQWINEKTNITAISSSSSNNNNNTDNRPVICSTKFKYRGGFGASIRNEFNERLCGGSIIGTNWILTAASCLHNRPLSSIYVGVGDEDFIYNHSYYAVDQIIIHDQYSPVTKQNNIALVRVQPYIQDNSDVRIARLADQPVIEDGTEAEMTYWLYKSRGTSNVRTVGWQQCKSIMTNNITYNINNDNNTTPVIDSNNLCLANYHKEITCNGDVGGSVTIDIPKQQQLDYCGSAYEKSVRLLIGILTDNLLCGSNRPTIMTNIQPYLQWINQKTNITAFNYSNNTNTLNSVLANKKDRPKNYWQHNGFGLGYPASLIINNTKRHFCSGSIIGPNWILTAASCLRWVYGNQISNVFVGVGKNDYQLNHTYFAVDKIVIHDKYLPNTKQNNIALVRIQSNITFGDLVRPIRLADDNQLPHGHNGTKAKIGAGWGTDSVWWFLHTLDVHKLDWQQCVSRMTYGLSTTKPIVDSNNVCVVADKGKGACDDDVGGPVIMVVKDKPPPTTTTPSTTTTISSTTPQQKSFAQLWIEGEQNMRLPWFPQPYETLMGVMSSGMSCGFDNQPDVVTSVVPFRQWIKDNTGI